MNTHDHLTKVEEMEYLEQGLCPECEGKIEIELQRLGPDRGLGEETLINCPKCGREY